MHMEVAYRGAPADLGLKRYVGLRLMSALDQFERDVEGVTVLLHDVGEAEGEAGVEQRCRIVARLDFEVQVAAEHTGAGMYASIDGAAERLADLVRLAATARVAIR